MVPREPPLVMGHGEVSDHARPQGWRESEIIGFQEPERVELPQRLLGQVTPSRQVTVELHFAGGAVGLYSDPEGRFDFDGVLPGPVSLVIRTPGNLEVIKTEWTVL